MKKPKGVKDCLTSSGFISSLQFDASGKNIQHKPQNGGKPQSGVAHWPLVFVLLLLTGSSSFSKAPPPPPPRLLLHLIGSFPLFALLFLDPPLGAAAARQTLPSCWRRSGHVTVVSVELGERQHGRHACGVSKQIAPIVQLTPPRRERKIHRRTAEQSQGPSVPERAGKAAWTGTTNSSSRLSPRQKRSCW